MSIRGRGQESGLKAALLDWCKGRIGGYKGVQLTNLTTSWKDGLAFCALVHSIDPTALNYDALDPSAKLKNCKMAFAAAAKIGISELLDAEDVVEIDCPEPLSMMTYISQYYHHVNGTGRNWNGSMRGSPAPEVARAQQSHGLMRGSVDISALELKRMRADDASSSPLSAKPALTGAQPIAEKEQKPTAAPVSYIPRPDLARTGSYRGSALARQGSISGLKAAASPSPKTSTNDKLLPSVTASAPPPSLGASRQMVSMPVISAADEKRKLEADLRAQEEAKKKKILEEDEQQVDARRKESEAVRASELKRKEVKEAAEKEKEREREKEEAMKLKVQQETERRLAEQRRRDELRAKEEKQKKANTSQPRANADEEERKRARLAKWAAESAASDQTEFSLSITTAKNPLPVPAEGEEVRIKCLDDGAEWKVPINTVSRMGFEAAVKRADPGPSPPPSKLSVAEPAAKAAESSCLIM